MQTTGSNLNAGSTSADAAAFTYASGTLATVTNVATFTVASGNPSSDGVVVGDYISIYPDGNSTTPFVSKVTSVTSTTIVCSSINNKFGTVPTDGTLTRTVKVGGAWANLGMVASGVALNTGTVPFSTRINVKAGTYANTTTGRTFALAGSATLGLWWRGYKTAIGDLDTQPTTTRVDATDIPLWTFTTGQMIVSGASNVFSNISILSACVTSNGAVSTTGAQAVFYRVRIENTAANSLSRALTSSGGGDKYIMCWFKATTTPNSAVFASTSTQQFHGCVFRGGGAGNSIEGNGSVVILWCIFDSPTGSGLVMNGGTEMLVAHSIFYNAVGSGISIGAAPLSSCIINCIFEKNGAYGITNTSGTNIDQPIRAGNSFYLNTSGKENGFGDAPSHNENVETASHFVDAAGHDFTLLSTTTAKAGGIPGLFENATYKSFPDIGAVQREEPASSLGSVEAHMTVIIPKLEFSAI